MILGSGLIQSAGWTPEWLIRDEFTDTRAAGSVNGTAATPGPGTRTVTDTGNLVSVGSGVLATVAPASPGIDPRTLYGAITRTTGLCLVARYNSVSGNDQGAAFHSGPATSTGNGIGIRQISGDIVVRAASGSSISTISLDGTAYELCVVAHSTGAIMLARKSGDATWKLLWIDNAGAWATVYPGVANYQASYSIDYLRVTQLPAPFDTDDGLATDTHGGSVAAGTTFAHEADCLVEYTVTMLSALGNIDVLFRVQDASNYWICRTNSSGDISLQEVVAGSATQRSNTAGVVANGHRIVIIADGTTIKVYSNNTLRITYASATNFATATAGEVDALGTGGVVSDLKTWPRTLSGEAAAILNKASA